MLVQIRLAETTGRRVSAAGMLAAAWVLLSGCLSSAPIPPGVTPTPPSASTAPMHGPAAAPDPTPNPLDLSVFGRQNWDVYDSDPEHLWNRIFRQFYRRSADDGTEYGEDALDPLLWSETTHLLEGTEHEQAVALLDEFLAAGGETLSADPLQRAVFLRDLWAVFDWLAILEDHPDQRAALRERLAQIIRRVALTREEIDALPDNYTLAAASAYYYGEYQPDAPSAEFLPAGLSQPDGGWVLLGREGGPMAMTHTESFPFYGRSVFMVFIHLPEGRDAALAFAQGINAARSPAVPDGTEVALVRRALLVDSEGQIVLSPLTESVQIRHFLSGNGQQFYEFILHRELLFAGVSGGLMPTHGDIPVFASHGDPFMFGFIQEAEVPEFCVGCHSDGGAGVVGAQSILSVSRARFALPDQTLPMVVETTAAAEAQAVIAWKQQHAAWIALEALMESAGD